MSESVPRAISCPSGTDPRGAMGKIPNESTLALLLDYTEGIKTQAGRFHSLFLK